MIRSGKQLAQVLADGRAVSLQGLFTGGGLRLAVEGTDEPVNRRALAICIRQGKARLLQSDLVGEPYRRVGA